ncbi:hypothetical protein [Bacillus sp. AFS088145]|uniref:hypothetical protein n=1 Tax=Bacillus sp. AFS088145 TaxID=2033514 RepID=UPI002570436C|nr:hypothetical protein [Bacillus sp. AFS088145]
MNIHKISATHTIDNPTSGKIMVKVGMKVKELFAIWFEKIINTRIVESMGFSNRSI